MRWDERPMTSCEEDPDAWPGWLVVLVTAFLFGWIVVGVIFIAG